METYDIIMLVVLAAMTFFGFIKGFAWQVAWITSMILSAMLAVKFGPVLAPQVGGAATAMLVVYAGTSFFVWMAFRVVAGTIERVKLRDFDRQIGGLFGFVRGALYCVVITFFAVIISDSTLAAVRKSKSASYIARLISEARTVMPPEVLAKVNDYLRTIDQGLDPTQARPDSPLPLPGSVPEAVQNALPNGLPNLQSLPFPSQPGAPQYNTPQYNVPPYNTPQYNAPQYNAPQFPYPPYQSGGAAPATYPPGYDYRNGQTYAPQNR